MMNVTDARRFLEKATQDTEGAVSTFMQPIKSNDPEELKAIIQDLSAAGLSLAVRYIDETGLDVKVPIDGDA